MKTALNFRRNGNQGFTLIELLIVVGILAVLSVGVFVALNPAKRLSDARDARRGSEISTILTAIHEYIVDNKGSIPAGLSSSEQQLGSATSGCTLATAGCASGDACVDLSLPLAKYLKSIPIDPKGSPNYDSTKTGYSISVDANGIVTVKACGAEGGVISVSR